MNIEGGEGGEDLKREGEGKGWMEEKRKMRV